MYWFDRVSDWHSSPGEALAAYRARQPVESKLATSWAFSGMTLDQVHDLVEAVGEMSDREFMDFLNDDTPPKPETLAEMNEANARFWEDRI